MTTVVDTQGTESCPPQDPVFLHLLEQAIGQSLGVFVAEVPLDTLRRHSPDYRPDLSSVGQKIVARIAQDWKKGHRPRLWVYSNRDHFIVSDDYHALAAAEVLKAELVPVYIIGIYPQDKVAKLDGVLAKTSLLKMFGMKDQ